MTVKSMHSYITGFRGTTHDYEITYTFPNHQKLSACSTQPAVKFFMKPT